MKLYTICPITESRINERIARSNAVLSLILLTAFAFTQHIVLIVFLAVDFLLRAIPYNRYSLVAITSRHIIKQMPVDNNMINAGPKIFAARIGTLITGLIVLSMTFSLDYVSMSLTGLLVIFSFLEGAFGICVACKIYSYLYNSVYK
jgi:hypothetical protein